MNEFDRQTLANCAEIVGAFSIVGALTFSAVQIREFKQSQPSWAEWFQLLAEQLKAVEGCKDPAHVRLKDRYYQCAGNRGWSTLI